MQTLLKFLPKEIVEKIYDILYEINYKSVVDHIRNINTILLEGLYIAGLYSDTTMSHKYSIEEIEDYFNEPISIRGINYWDHKSELILDFAKNGEFSEWVIELYRK